MRLRIAFLIENCEYNWRIKYKSIRENQNNFKKEENVSSILSTYIEIFPSRSRVSTTARFHTLWLRQNIKGKN